MRLAEGVGRVTMKSILFPFEAPAKGQSTGVLEFNCGRRIVEFEDFRLTGGAGCSRRH